MRILLLSEIIGWYITQAEPPCSLPEDIQLGNINTENFKFSLFDYDVSIIHITEPKYSTSYFCQNLPKLLSDAKLSLEHGRTVICLPASNNFSTKITVGYNEYAAGMKAYEWLQKFGIDLQDNEGENIKPTGAGQAQIIQEYLKHATTYYQIVTKPISDPKKRLAIVNDTEIVVGIECQYKKGNLVILPPPDMDRENINIVVSSLLNVARRYYERSQSNIYIGDIPDWLGYYLIPYHLNLDSQIKELSIEKEKYDKLAYILYGTGPELENSVLLLLREIGMEVEKQSIGANIDLKVRHAKMDINLAIEVTGTRDKIHKDSSKVGQAWQYILDHDNNEDNKDRLIIIANTQCHLDPKERNQESYTPDVVELLGKNGVLLMTTIQLYEAWKAIKDGKITSEDFIRYLHDSVGLYGY